MQLSDYIGQAIMIRVKTNDGVRSEEMTLLGAEAGGIWVESQKAMNQMLDHFKVATAPTTFAFFFPYSQIEMITVPTEKQALNEKAFGV